MYSSLINIGTNMSSNHNLQGFLAHLCWISALIGWILILTTCEKLAFIASVCVWLFTFPLVRQSCYKLLATTKKSFSRSSKDLKGPLILDLVNKNRYLIQLGLNATAVNDQCYAERLLSSKGCKVEIVTDNLPKVTLKVEKQSRAKDVLCVSADPPWNGCALYLNVVNRTHVSSASIELWRTSESGAVESWFFSFEKGVGLMRCKNPEASSKVLRVRIVNQNTSAHLFTTTALDTGKLKNNRWSFEFGPNEVVNGQLIDSQTVDFTTRADGKVVQHRGTWLYVSLGEKYCMVFHTPVANRVLVLTCYSKPSAEVACAILTTFHANNPLTKVRVRSLQVASCLQGTLNPTLAGDDVFGPGNPGDSCYLRFKPLMALFDPTKPQFTGLGAEQVSEKFSQVTIRI